MTAFHMYAPLALAMALRLPAQSAICKSTTPPSQKGPHVFLEAVKPGARDTLLAARLCLVPPKAGVGSYMATLTFDSTAMRAIRVDPTGGMQVTNMNVPGAIRFAGAAPNGFARGPLATIVFKPLRGKALGTVKVTLVEANTPSGVSLVANAKVTGHPATNRSLGVVQTTAVYATGEGTPRTPPRSFGGAAPRIDSISPRSAKVDAEGVTDLVLYGNGFSPMGNTVLFDGASIEGLLSEAGGTIIRFAAPTRIPARGDVPVHRLAMGSVVVKVRTAAGTSNAVTFTIRGEGR